MLRSIAVMEDYVKVTSPIDELGTANRLPLHLYTSHANYEP